MKDGVDDAFTREIKRRMRLAAMMRIWSMDKMVNETTKLYDIMD